MTALRRLCQKFITGNSPASQFKNFESPTTSSNFIFPPFIFISRRGIASKLFIGGLSYYTTKKTLAEAFSHYGQVVEAEIVSDRVHKKSKGFGFVTYASEDEADKALAEMNGKALQGRVIFVDHAKPRINYGGGMPIARGPPVPITNG